MKINWGVIGCGGIAFRRTIPGLVKSENANLVAVMDTNFEVAKQVQKEFNASYAFDNVEDLLNLEEIDAVYIATPVFCHKEQVLKAASKKMQPKSTPVILALYQSLVIPLQAIHYQLQVLWQLPLLISHFLILRQLSILPRRVMKKKLAQVLTELWKKIQPLAL